MEGSSYSSWTLELRFWLTDITFFSSEISEASLPTVSKTTSLALVSLAVYTSLSTKKSARKQFYLFMIICVPYWTQAFVVQKKYLFYHPLKSASECPVELKVAPLGRERSTYCTVRRFKLTQHFVFWGTSYLFFLFLKSSFASPLMRCHVETQNLVCSH